MSDFSNDDFLSALREAQGAQRAKGPANFAEYMQERRLYKGPRGGTQSPLAPAPGFGLMGQANTSSRAPTGPNQRPSGNPGVGFTNGPSKYDDARPLQPPPFINDVNMGNLWFSPMQPVWPFGPPAYNVPREWNYPVGYNLNYVPERMDLVGTLRGMRRGWGVLATVIETRKDQMLRLPWTIQVRNKPRASSKAVDEVRKFFRRPDGKLSYSQWAGKLLDDLFCIDAPTLYIDRNISGGVRNAQILDGGTIFPLIDDVGRRPDTIFDIGPDGVVYEKRQPAFQQIIYGLPMIDLSEDEIIYAMRRPRPEIPVFGYSPVEQIMTEATEAIRKTFYQLEFWRSGSVPELIVTVPDAWTPRQIASFQAHFDALLSGQLSLKSKVRFLPGGMKPFDIKNASGESLWSQRDELLVRLVCYAFSVTPTPFIHQSNRATANQAQQTAEEEGLYPLMSYWKDDIMDTIIQEKFGYDEIEFTFLPQTEPDQEKQAKIHQIQIDEGLRSRNEVRGELGLEPVPDGDHLTVSTGGAVVRLDQVISGEALMPGAPAPAPDSKPKPAAPSSQTASPVKGPAAPRDAAPTSAATPVHKGMKAKLRAAEDATERHPTTTQTKIGNYPKGKFNLNGLRLSIENPKGSKRWMKDHEDKDVAVKMPAAYGYIRGTMGADDMQVDCYIGRKLKSPFVWVIDQDKFDPDGKDKGFDEHKVMLGYKTLERALEDYMASHFDDMGHERACAVTRLTYPELKHWLKHGKMRRPICEQGIGTVVARRGVGGGIGKADTIGSGTNLSSYDQTSATRGKKRKGRKKSRLVSGPKWLQLCA